MLKQRTKIIVTTIISVLAIGSINYANASNLAVDTTPADVLAMPMFDQTKDGPLLTKPKTIEIETNAGSITLYLDPSLAPIAATYIYKLLTSGAFNGTQIHRYEPNFVLQVNNVWEKGTDQPPLSNNLRALVRRIPLEVSTQKDGELNHHKYVISMAHYDGGPNSATGSFSMLMGSAPHLDHQYTIFGKVIDDPATTATFAKIETNWDPHKYWIVRCQPQK
jgi:cyclophilin family peptidyl-prolyl cis-trans isomerase